MKTNVSQWHWFEASASTHQTVKAIAQYGPIARIELAQKLGLTQGALSRITSDLMYWGVIREVQNTKNPTVDMNHPSDNAPLKKHRIGRGRPKTSLELCAQQRSFIGINIHSTGITATVTDALCVPQGKCLNEPLKGTDVTSVVRQLGDIALRCSASSPVRPAMIGISLGGHSVDGRTVTYAPFLKWDGDVRLAEMIEDSCSTPTLLSNDLDALLLHENWFSNAVNVPRFALVTIGSGIGYALSENGEAVDRPDRSYGLVGHIPLDAEGPVCYAGHAGCSQCLTTDSIVSEYATIIGKPCSIEEFMNDVNADRPQARRLIDRSCYRLGIFIAIMCNFAMPDKVLIGGETSSLYRHNLESIRKGMNAYRPTQAANIDFAIPDFSWDSWAISAAATAIAKYIG
ncbi:ROK family protein [Bifidobacterium bombi]|uniref:ROK family protein n=1 Tax=Bifidobacterium bombi DSM 19703 TaxID=1341695 RepID=A0A080N424_9BIFI|nr:ROK family protein [Bifidobacterium bombi]KFF30990.1 ROK family protein [Bifidobacterium bombi DSM 19703]